MPDPQRIVEMRNINKTFGGVRALKGVSFSCNTGEVHTVVGQNGAGKSTLMKILAGDYLADDGEIYLAGKRARIVSPRDAQALGISIIHQELNLLPELSVAANVFLGREPRSLFGFLTESEMMRRSSEVLKRLGVDINPAVHVGSLSIAQQQMVEIARSLLLQARVVIMDEPSATLGTRELERLFQAIDSLKRQGVAIIYISHRLAEVFMVSDRVTVFRDGEVVGSRPVAEFDRVSLVRMMIGSSTFTEQFPARGASAGREVLRIENLSSEPVLHGVSLSVHSGEIVGLAGLMGSGRSELARAILGVLPCNKGAVWLNGAPVRFRSPRIAIARGIGYLPESRKEEGLVMGMSIMHNTALPSLRARQILGFVRGRAERTKVGLTATQLAIRTPTLLQEVERLSGGNQQKVAIAKWLICDPTLLIFDEPTRGVDVLAKTEIWKLMRALANAGAAVLMISSELPEVIGMSDRVVVLHKGRVAGELAAAQADEETILTLASFGESLSHAGSN
ncbi:MAG TPA: sugar ABC transporter ATP-binding protein [Spirochaetia bacterium]|nr:sugar ABC transporter ATP-binding protein [Spirochaetia bacterium]